MSTSTASVARPARAEVKLPFGRTSDGRMVSIEAATRGKGCECFCPSCGASLVAAKGQIYQHHFRHYVEHGAECTEARETALHLFAKQVICEALFVGLPDPVGTMTKATAECRCGDVIPDVLAEYDSGESVAIEVWVAHQVPPEKVRHYNKQRQTAVEIDLRLYKLTDRNETSWRDVVLFRAERSWLSPPEYIRERREAERKQWLRQQLARARAERALMKQREQERIAAEKALEAQRARQAVIETIRREERAVIDAMQRETAQRDAAEYERRKLKLAMQRAKDAEARRVIEMRLRREMRAPDLQELVTVHGGYDRITPEAWVAYRSELKNWQLRTADGEFHKRPYRNLRQDDEG